MKGSVWTETDFILKKTEQAGGETSQSLVLVSALGPLQALYWGSWVNHSRPAVVDPFLPAHSTNTFMDTVT